LWISRFRCWLFALSLFQNAYFRPNLHFMNYTHSDFVKRMNLNTGILQLKSRSHMFYGQDIVARRLGRSVGFWRAKKEPIAGLERHDYRLICRIFSDLITKGACYLRSLRHIWGNWVTRFTHFRSKVHLI